MESKILLFGGTSEGRKLAECALRHKLDCEVYVATAAGADYLKEIKCSLHIGRLDEAGILREIRRQAPCIVMDATHPYAQEVTENLRKACGSASVEYIRVQRESSDMHGDAEVDSAPQAAEYLAKHFADVPILLTNGSKELHHFAGLCKINPRIYARILYGEENRQKALAAGIKPEHIISGNAQYSREDNARCFKQYDIRCLLTKQSGAAGGYEDKLAAAAQCGVFCLVIRRPAEEDGMNLKAAKQWIKEKGNG